MPIGHALRTCILSMRLARRIRISESEISDLFFAALLKDVGSASRRTQVFDLLALESTNAQLFLRNRPWDSSHWNHLPQLLQQSRLGPNPAVGIQRVLRVALHKNRIARGLNRSSSEEGYAVAQELGLSTRTAETVLHRDEYWDGTGRPTGKRHGQIPLLSRILGIAQMLEAVGTAKGHESAIRLLHRRSMNRFDPGLVAAATLLHDQGPLWNDMESQNLVATALRLGPQNSLLPAPPSTIDRLCVAFARIIDARSRFTYRHSERVAQIAISIGVEMGIDEHRMGVLRRAALLHDLGNLMQPPPTSEQQAKPTKDELTLRDRHTQQANDLLQATPGFSEVAEVILGHHERLDGSGYPLRRKGEEIPVLSRILGVAEVFDTLSSERPYQPRMSPKAVYSLLEAATPVAFDPRCVHALYVTAALHAAA